MTVIKGVTDCTTVIEDVTDSITVITDMTDSITIIEDVTVNKMSRLAYVSTLNRT